VDHQRLTVIRGGSPAERRKRWLRRRGRDVVVAPGSPQIVHWGARRAGYGLAPVVARAPRLRRRDRGCREVDYVFQFLARLEIGIFLAGTSTRRAGLRIAPRCAAAAGECESCRSRESQFCRRRARNAQCYRKWPPDDLDSLRVISTRGRPLQQIGLSSSMLQSLNRYETAVSRDSSQFASLTLGICLLRFRLL